jgi:peptidoglycan hydrolase-like protein with peptidoglycan-binding domain
MNIIANNVASKLFVAFVAAAMLFTLATPAKAATASELQAQIDALMAQIAGLQGGNTSGGSASAACTFTRALTVGSQGEDVKCLQAYLTPTYFKNAAGATGYFGPVTASAVAAWQTANGVSPAAGYFGPVSQAKYNAMAAMSDDDSDDDSSDDDSDDTSDDDSDDTDSGELSGEASLDTFEVQDGDDSDEAEEGDEAAQVAEFQVEFNDGDAVINRIDVILTVDAGNDGDDDPWDVFQELTLWVDGDEVASMDASDEDEYLDEDDGTIRFAGLDIVAREDEEVTIVVGASINESVDGSADGEGWNLGAESIRFTDADDVTTTEDSTGDLGGTDAEFTIDEAGAGDDLDLETSDEDPDSTTLSLDEDDNTELAIFAFDLSAEDSDGDVDLNEITIGIQTDNDGENAVVDTLVNDFRLEIDGESYEAESYVGSATTTTLVFDIDGDSVVSADEAATAVLFADFENMDDASDEGSTIFATVTTASIDAESSESGEDVTVGGSNKTGNTHTLRTEGLDLGEVTDGTGSSDSTQVVSGVATTDNYGTMFLTFEITAFGDDLFIATNRRSCIHY